MKKALSRLLNNKNNPEAYIKLNEKFKNDVKYNTEYQEFERYVNLQINYETEISDDYLTSSIEGIEIIPENKMYNILLFNVLEGFIDDVSEYQKENFVYNFPKLYAWINEYKNKPIENLSDDECKIIQGIIHSMSYDELVENLELNIYNKNYEAVSIIIENLPRKFSVRNLTQMIFRIILLKPYLFDIFDDDLTVKGLKGVKNVLPRFKP